PEQQTVGLLCQVADQFIQLLFFLDGKRHFSDDAASSCSEGVRVDEVGTDVTQEWIGQQVLNYTGGVIQHVISIIHNTLDGRVNFIVGETVLRGGRADG